jgi:acyl phosphate:glycerol-3-phosphate acyltransferase
LGKPKRGPNGLHGDSRYHGQQKPLLRPPLESQPMPAAAVLGLTLVVAYLVGAVPFGYLIARARGVDILREGSGNIGATNVGRILGRRFGILVFLLDFAKGAVPAATALMVPGRAEVEASLGLGPDLLPVGAGLSAFLGHLFPVYLRFRGGKGVATGAGVVAVLLPGPALGALLVWVSAVCAWRYVSLASLAAAAALVLLRLIGTADPFAFDHAVRTAFCLITGGLVIVKHRSNVGRLLHGTENRLRETPAMLLFTKTVHVLALGLWFGTIIFFTLVVAIVLLSTFETLGSQPAAERPAWLPVASDLDKDKGIRLFGFAIGPLFPWFFLVQGVCGLLAVATALSWPSGQPSPTVAKVRTWCLLLALATVLAGWPLAQKVSRLRLDRYSADSAVAEGARAAFGSWHTYSLSLTFVTMILVGIAMALAAQLPSGTPAVSSEQTKEG